MQGLKELSDLVKSYQGLRENEQRGGGRGWVEGVHGDWAVNFMQHEDYVNLCVYVSWSYGWRDLDELMLLLFFCTMAKRKFAAVGLWNLTTPFSAHFKRLLESDSLQVPPLWIASSLQLASAIWTRTKGLEGKVLPTPTLLSCHGH